MNRLALPSFVVIPAFVAVATVLAPACGGAADQDVLSTTIGTSTKSTTSSTSSSSGTVSSSGTSGTTTSGGTSGGTGTTSGNPGTSSGDPGGCPEEKEDNDNEGQATALGSMMCGTLLENKDTADYLTFQLGLKQTFELAYKTDNPLIILVKNPIGEERDFEKDGSPTVVPGKWFVHLRPRSNGNGGNTIHWQVTLTIK